MLTTHNSELAAQATDVLFHPTSRNSAASCPLQPPTESQMDAAGITGALVSQCKKWSCERQWMCVDTRLQDVLHYTESSPRYIGLAGYNPFDIAESLCEIDLAVSTHGFRGVYLHAASFNLPLTSARMYPLFAKAVEIAVPVLVQLPVGREACDLRSDVRKLATDFPDLSLVLAPARTQLPDFEVLAREMENVFFALDPGSLAHFKEELNALTAERGSANSDFFSGIFQQRCMWGSNGMSWPGALRAADCLPLLPEAREHFFRRNAERVFSLSRPAAARAPRSVLTEIVVAER